MSNGCFQPKIGILNPHLGRKAILRCEMRQRPPCGTKRSSFRNKLIAPEPRGIGNRFQSNLEVGFQPNGLIHKPLTRLTKIHPVFSFSLVQFRVSERAIPYPHTNKKGPPNRTALLLSL